MNLAHILSTDHEVRNELLDRLGPSDSRHRSWGIVGGAPPSPLSRGILRAAVEHPDGLLPGVDEREAIIRLFGRPVLFVRRGSFDVETFEDPESQVWSQRLNESRPLLEAAIPSVGRVELRNSLWGSWVGTGWVVAPGVLVTNRHVADEFAYSTGGVCEFRRGIEGRRIRASVNFGCEYQEDEDSEHQVEQVLHIEDADGPDVAFLRVRGTSSDDDPLPPPIALSDDPPGPGQRVAVIGYPAADGRRNDVDLMHRLFRGVYGVKRLAPGEVVTSLEDYFTHDCTTLGGNSGSVVLDLASGRAAGLHFGGLYASENYAVPARLIADRLRLLGIER